MLRFGTIGGPIRLVTYLGDEDEKMVFSDVPDSESEAPSPVPLTIILGHPRPPVLKRVLRDLSAIAVCSIVVFDADLGEKAYGKSSVWNSPRHLLVDGAMQGGVTALPDLMRADSLDFALDRTHEQGTTFLVDLPRECGTTRTQHLISHLPPLAGAATLIVGPERGFSPRERALCATAPVVALGTTTLRTETAVMAAAVAFASAMRSTS